MDLIKQRLDRISQQLSGLSASQKMLAGSLVAVMILTLMWWGKYAGQAEREPLLTQSLAPEELKRMTDLLEARGISYDVSSDRKILVSADRKLQILGALGWADSLPKNTANGFDEIIKQMTPWDGQDRNSMMFNRGKEITLGGVIRGFPDVADATVAIDPKHERVIGQNIEPTAFVSIRMKSGTKPSRQLPTAAANVVAGAQAGLAVRNIKIVIDGVPHHVNDSADPVNGPDIGDFDERRQRWEGWLSQKVTNHLADIPGTMVAVTVNINIRAIKERSHDVKKVEEKVLRSTNNSSDSSSNTPTPPAEPGATPNLGGAMGTGVVGSSSSGGGESTNKTEEKLENALFPSWKETESSTAAGEATVMAASVRIPRSHFIRIIKSEKNDATEPDEKTIRQRIQDELPRIKVQVANCIGLKDPTTITVDPYSDIIPVAPTPAEVSTASSFSLALGGHTKEIVLGLLAVVSLFMVSNIIRKSAPPAPAPKPVVEGPKGPIVLEGGETIVGEAGEGNPLLDGMELDEEALKTQQMFTQVSGMVDENPDAAAALVKRWLNRT